MPSPECGARFHGITPYLPREPTPAIAAAVSSVMRTRAHRGFRVVGAKRTTDHIPEMDIPNIDVASATRWNADA